MVENIYTRKPPVPNKPDGLSLSGRSSEPVSQSQSLKPSKPPLPSPKPARSGSHVIVPPPWPDYKLRADSMKSSYTGKPPVPAKPVARPLSVRSSKPPLPSPPPVATNFHVTDPPHQFLDELSNRAVLKEECAQRVYEELEIREGSEVLCAELAERHSHKLPVVVELSRSLYGLCEDLTLTAGDRISLHFLKKTECVRIAGKDGQVLSVPINSSLRFSPQYEGLEKYNILNFGSVKKLVLARPHPLVVCVTKKGNPENDKSASTVAIGDVLVLKESKRRTFREGHVLCFNTRSNQEFRLKEDSEMQFTIKSEWTKLSLSHLLQHIKLPQRCLVHAEEDAQRAELRLLRRVFHERNYTVLSPSLETSFVASCHPGQLGDESIVEIASDFDVPVRMIKTSALTKHSLLERTNDLFSSFHPRLVSAFISSNTHFDLDRMALRKGVSDSDARVGIMLIQPESMEHPPTAQSGHQYDYVEFDHIKEGNKKPSSELRHEDAMVAQQRMLNYRLEDPKEKTTPFQHADMEQMQLYNQCYEIVTIATASESLSQTDNKSFLGSLSCKQVLQLLDCMQLSVYKPTFQQEGVTGDILLELDESILEEELGIQSRIHRIRIMKLITGQYSAKELLAQST